MTHQWRRLGVVGVVVCAYVPALGVVRHVDDSAPTGGDGLSWATANNNLFTALLGAGPGDEIRVGAGTYKPLGASARATSFFGLHDGMSLRGGYAGYGAPDPNHNDRAVYLTTLSGDLAGNDGPGFTHRSDNALHVVKITGTGAACVLDGFTIVGGQAELTGHPEQNGGGVHAAGASVITRCVLRDNYAHNGGALYLDRSSQISDCTFELNRALFNGGAAHLNWVQAAHTFRRCIFLANEAGNTGGAVDLYYAYPLFIECTFAGNQANGFGGAINGGYFPIHCINCGFFGNTAQGVGGAIWVEMNGTLTGCVFSGNSSTQQAGAANGIARMHNCTVANNHSNTQAGGIIGGCEMAVKNSLFWGNSDQSGTGQSAQLTFYGTLQIDYSSVQGWTGAWGGTANNGLNPRFVLPAGFDGVIGTMDDNLRLMPADLPAGSPALDSGDNTAVPPDTGDVDEDGDTAEPLPLDIDRRPRIANDASVLPDADVVNRGAYENDHPAPQITAWRSMRTHGPTGTFAVVLDPAAGGDGSTGPVSEPRNGGVRDIQVDYSASVQLKPGGSVSVLVYPNGAGGIGPSMDMSFAAIVSMVDSNTLRVFLPNGLPPLTCVKLDVSNTVVDMSNNMISGDKDCYLRNLPADVTSSGIVTLSDVLAARARMTPVLASVSNAHCDFNLNGAIDLSDIQQIKTRILPVPQRALCP